MDTERDEADPRRRRAQPRPAGPEQIDCEAAIVGAGGAGLAAALLLARTRRSVVVVDDGRPRNAPSAQLRGFLGRDRDAPAELLRAGREEVRGYGARLLDARVERLDEQRVLHLRDGRRVRAERVLLASGLHDELPEVPGAAERWGRDVLHCPYCHAREAGPGPFVVLGTHPGAVHQSLLLRQWSDDVTLLGEPPRSGPEQFAMLAAAGVRLQTGRAEGIVVEADAVTAVRTGSGVLPCRAVFVFPVPRPRDGFTAQLGLERDEAGFPVTDATGRTSLPWLYAAGNAADPRLPALAAAGDGQRAAFAMHNAWVAEQAATLARGAR